MRVLCDQNVDERYVETFRETDWMTVSTVRAERSPAARDEEISRFAADNDWLVFTGDDDFLEYDHDCGVVLYLQTERPSPGAVVDALEAIDEAYAEHDDIHEFVPGGWTGDD